VEISAAGVLEAVYHECLEIELELSISGSKNFASFRVFSGPQNISAQRLAPMVLTGRSNANRERFGNIGWRSSSLTKRRKF
jgi:hypothetical protein